MILFLAFLLAAPNARAGKDPEWHVVGTKGVPAVIVDEHDSLTKAAIKLEGSSWKCETVPDAKNRKDRYSVSCNRGEAHVVLPLVCMKGVAQLSALTLMEADGTSYGISLTCAFPAAPNQSQRR